MYYRMLYHNPKSISSFVTCTGTSDTSGMPGVAKDGKGETLLGSNIMRYSVLYSLCCIRCLSICFCKLYSSFVDENLHYLYDTLIPSLPIVGQGLLSITFNFYSKLDVRMNIIYMLKGTI